MPDNHEAAALEFLRTQLGPAAPEQVQLAARFDERPLEGEGAASVFSFRAGVGGAPPENYWVVAGATEPNYYPHWGLTVDEVYSVHVGTRFMLVIETSRVESAALPTARIDTLRGFLADVAPSETIEFLSGDGSPADAPAPIACFRCGEELHGVFRVRIGREDVYVLGLDCPPGIYRDTHLPPHVVYRRHLGALIRNEPAETSDND